MSLPDPELGAERLRGSWFAVAGEPIVTQLAESLGGRVFTIDDEDRALYRSGGGGVQPPRRPARTR